MPIMADSDTSRDEVVATLAQTALIAFTLVVFVMATRVAQVSFDKRQAARAREEALASARQRLRTLSDRIQLYRTASSGTLATASLVAPATAAAEAIGVVRSPAPEPPRYVHGDDPWAGDPSFDDGRTWLHPSADAVIPGGDAAAKGASCLAPTPPVSQHSPVSLLGSAASALLSRRAVVTPCPSAASSCAASALPSGSSTVGCSSSRSNSTVTHVDPAPISWSDQTLTRSHSLSGPAPLHRVPVTAGGGGGDSSSGSLRNRGAGAGRHSLQHKASDSLLETCRVLASVPQETITSTRQVLAAFNYDYSALHRRESSYVSGSPYWRARVGE